RLMTRTDEDAGVHYMAPPGRGVASAPTQIQTGSPVPVFAFDVLHRDGSTRARAGRLTTPHGAVETPVFMPVGTRASVKGILPAQLREVGATFILSNTYHLAIRPGADVIAALGGLHHFMCWNGPILTDSGGYQVFSLATLRDIDDD